jgi:hypothetical protein
MLPITSSRGQVELFLGELHRYNPQWSLEAGDLWCKELPSDGYVSLWVLFLEVCPLWNEADSCG